MSQEELQRRVRAMDYPNYPGAFIDFGNQRFYASDWPSRLSSDITSRPFVPVLDEILAPMTSSIHDVVRCIDRSRIGIALLVDDNRKLIATVTDGDLRRALLAGVTFADPALRLLDFKSIAAHPAPISRPLSTPDDELLRIMRTADVQHVPLLDDQGRVADLALLRSFFRSSASTVHGARDAAGAKSGPVDPSREP
jgi:CBS domain-containing protein